MTTTPEPWNLTEAQCRQFREAHAQAAERRRKSGWLCDLSDGDLITIQWSGQLRTVAVVVTGEDVALRDLTKDERAELAEDDFVQNRHADLDPNADEDYDVRRAER